MDAETQRRVTMKKSICHRDGTVTYWSVYDQVWENHVEFISDRELAAMSSQERERVYWHLKEHSITYRDAIR
jgi:hypothetical protein